MVLDNYDSFTYNLVQRLGEIDPSVDIRVIRNDKITIGEIRTLKPDRILISPGPCSPSEAGISVPIVEQLAGEYPILGVCLGHQSIGQALGGKIVRAPELMHGKTDLISHDNRGFFCWIAESVCCDSIPLAGDRSAQFAGRSGSLGLGRWAEWATDNGRAPSPIPA